MSERNRELVHWDEPKEKEQSESAYATGAQQMISEERERQRDAMSIAKPDADDPRRLEERILPEGAQVTGGEDYDARDVGEN